MSSLDHQQDSATERYGHTTPLPVSDSVTEYSPVEQLSFPSYSVKSGTSQPAARAMMTRQLSEPISVADEMDPESDSISSPVGTQSLFVPRASRALTEVQTDALASVSLQRNTTRHPVIIRGTGRRSVSPLPPKSRRRPVMHIAVTGVLALMILGALFAVLPVSGGQSSLLKMITGNDRMDITSVKTDNTALIERQAATATAVTQDGYDPGQMTVAGVPTPPPVVSGNTGTNININTNTGTTGSTGGYVSSNVGSLNRFFYGQCTYWANMRYHQLTGYWVTWLGNANEWYGGALGAGWVVSSTPNPHGSSIVVLQAGVEGAGGYGHVAVVESILGNGTVSASNWNWAGNWGATTYVNFTYPAPGVAFIWHG